MTEQPHRILVTGSRTWTNRMAVYGALDAVLHKYVSIVVVHGACPTGADAMAADWIAEAGAADVTEDGHAANWNAPCDPAVCKAGHRRSGTRGSYCPAAGPRRNNEMVAAGAVLCLAFIRRGSRGASQCAEAAETAGIPIVIHREDM